MPENVLHSPSYVLACKRFAFVWRTCSLLLRQFVNFGYRPTVQSRLTSTLSWRRGVVVSGVRRMNEVNPRRARLVLACVTVFGRVYHLGM